MDTLTRFAASLTTAWGPVTSGLVDTVVQQVALLLEADASEPWLAALHDEGPASRELLRDPARGFVLLAHTEHAGQYRPPHDHGRGWVVYAVERGEMEMTTYRRVHDLAGKAYLVKRESFVLGRGDTRVFLPGDVHDTRCLAGPLTLFRLTSRDLKQEEVTRYPGAVATPRVAV